MNRRNQKLLSIALGTGLLLSTTVVSAFDRREGETTRFTEFADVIDVQPVYRNIRVREPQQECWIETQQHLVGYERPRHEPYRTHRSERRHSSSGAVVGGIIGGVIGNQLGRGESRGTRAGATIAGAIIGSTVVNEAQGRPIRHRREPARIIHQGAPIYETREIERCKKVSASRVEQQLQHYNVTYRYQGRTYTTRTKRDPGRRLELQVSVKPARQ